jgi:hypothetical protein
MRVTVTSVISELPMPPKPASSSHNILSFAVEVKLAAHFCHVLIEVCAFRSLRKIVRDFGIFDIYKSSSLSFLGLFHCSIPV